MLLSIVFLFILQNHDVLKFVSSAVIQQEQQIETTSDFTSLEQKMIKKSSENEKESSEETINEDSDGIIMNEKMRNLTIDGEILKEEEEVVAQFSGIPTDEIYLSEMTTIKENSKPQDIEDIKDEFTRNFPNPEDSSTTTTPVNIISKKNITNLDNLFELDAGEKLTLEILEVLLLLPYELDEKINPSFWDIFFGILACSMGQCSKTPKRTKEPILNSGPLHQSP